MVFFLSGQAGGWQALWLCCWPSVLTPVLLRPLVFCVVALSLLRVGVEVGMAGPAAGPRGTVGTRKGEAAHRTPTVRFMLPTCGQQPVSQGEGSVLQ